MTLKDLMADDLTSVFLNTDEFADDVRFQVKGPDNFSFALVAIIGDPAPTFVQIDGGQEDRRPVTVMAKRSSIRTGINSITGIARDPIKGDAIVVESGTYQGTWTVNTAQPDDGDAMIMQCVKSDLYTANVTGAREIR